MHSVGINKRRAICRGPSPAPRMSHLVLRRRGLQRGGARGRWQLPGSQFRQLAPHDPPPASGRPCRPCPLQPASCIHGSVCLACPVCLPCRLSFPRPPLLHLCPGGLSPLAMGSICLSRWSMGFISRSTQPSHDATFRSQLRICAITCATHPAAGETRGAQREHGSVGRVEKRERSQRQRGGQRQASEGVGVGVGEASLGTRTDRGTFEFGSGH